MRPAPARLAFLAAGDAEVASARLRAHLLAEALRVLGFAATCEDTTACDVLVVQKRIDATVLALAESARERGACVVYDADDSGRALDYWAPRRLRRRLFALASGIVSDTAGHLAALAREWPWLPAAIVPDMVDYGATAPVGPAQPPPGPLRILWFGSVSNFRLLEPRLGQLTRLPDAEMVVCTRLPEGSDLPRRWPGIRWEAWSSASFVATLRSCHLTVLMHDGSEADRAKSDNRMASAIAWGVPVVASATPAYAELAAAAGIGDCLFADDRSLIAAVDRLRAAEARAEQLRRAQPVVWALRSPRAVAAAFAETVARMRGRPPAPPSRWARLAHALGLDRHRPT